MKQIRALQCPTVSPFRPNYIFENINILRFTKAHPDQKEIIASLNSKLTDEESDNTYTELNRIAGKDGMEKYMIENELDIVVSNSDCSLIAFTSCTGWPSATVPLGLLENRLPYGLFLLAKANEEEKLFRFMSAFEKSMPGVEAPVLKDA